MCLDRASQRCAILLVARVRPEQSGDALPPSSQAAGLHRLLLQKTPECAVASGVFSRPEFPSTYGKTCGLVTGLYVALCSYGAKPVWLPNHAHDREKGNRADLVSVDRKGASARPVHLSEDGRYTAHTVESWDNPYHRHLTRN